MRTSTEIPPGCADVVHSDRLGLDTVEDFKLERFILLENSLPEKQNTFTELQGKLSYIDSISTNLASSRVISSRVIGKFALTILSISFLMALRSASVICLSGQWKS